MVTVSSAIAMSTYALIGTTIKTPHCSCSSRMIEDTHKGSAKTTHPMADQCPENSSIVDCYLTTYYLTLIIYTCV